MGEAMNPSGPEPVTAFKAPEHGKVEPKVPENGDMRKQKRLFLRELADLLEKFEAVAETDTPLALDGGQWRFPGGIKRGD
jgi:hypothetical protein